MPEGSDGHPAKGTQIGSFQTWNTQFLLAYFCHAARAGTLLFPE